MWCRLRRHHMKEKKILRGHLALRQGDAVPLHPLSEKAKLSLDTPEQLAILRFIFSCYRVGEFIIYDFEE